LGWGCVEGRSACDGDDFDVVEAEESGALIVVDGEDVGIVGEIAMEVDQAVCVDVAGITDVGKRAVGVDRRGGLVVDRDSVIGWVVGPCHAVE